MPKTRYVYSKREVAVFPHPRERGEASPAVVMIIGGLLLHFAASGTLAKASRAIRGAPPSDAQRQHPIRWPEVKQSLIRETLVLGVVGGSVWVVEQFDRNAAWVYAFVVLALMASQNLGVVASITDSLSREIRKGMQG